MSGMGELHLEIYAQVWIIRELRAVTFVTVCFVKSQWWDLARWLTSANPLWEVRQED